MPRKAKEVLGLTPRDAKEVLGLAPRDAKKVQGPTPKEVGVQRAYEALNILTTSKS